MSNLDVLLQEAYELRPLPASVARLTALFSEDDWDLAEITGAIQLDPALTGRLLGLANSPISGPRARIVSVEDAVLRMGPGMVLSMAIGAAIRPELSRDIPAYDLDEGALWRHSVAAALAVECSAPHCKRAAPTEAYVAALLHDIAKIVIGRHLPSAMATAMAGRSERAARSETSVEAETLGISHGKLGGLVARNWGLPAGIPSGIAYHHAPEQAPDDLRRTIAAFVSLGDVVGHAIGEVCGGYEGPRLTRAVVRRVGLTRSGFEDLTRETARRFSEVMRLYEA